MNQFITLKSRQDATRALIDSELALLQQQNYNPILGTFEQPLDDDLLGEGMIDPATPFVQALSAAQLMIKKAKKTMDDIKSTVKGVSAAAQKLRISTIPISKVTRKHIKVIFQQCAKDNPKWSAHRHNQYRSYLMIVFSELIEMEATEIDPVAKIKKQKTVKRIRERLSLEDRSRVNEYLKESHYSFWRFMHIFFHSGARETELMLIRKQDVDLLNQRYKMTIKKGKQYRETWRTIKDIVLPLWKEVIEQAKSDDFLFSDGLIPGYRAINSNQVCRRWNRHVKKKLGITADFYSLKHSNLDETAAVLSAIDAQKMAAHTSLIVTMDHYLGGEKERQHERLRQVKNEF
ncbi:tyrosine-type recombinase/integrase [Flavitalea sp.]|nr:hypothetical protein [Flavitalea sp.]